MRVLWFAVSPSLYQSTSMRKDQGLGWIASLERIVRTEPSIELGIAFEHRDSQFKTVQDGVTYYPMNVFDSRLRRWKRRFNRTEEELFMPHCLKVIEDFKPDIIHVFGSEWCYGLVQEKTDIPVVIHMQGSIPPYNNATFPPGYNFRDELIFNKWWHFKQNYYKELGRKFETDRGIREERILSGCKYFMGRTDWDYSLTKLYAPNSAYYLCWEALRPEFVNPNETPWSPKKRDKCVLLSTCGRSKLKGLDTILKTAFFLKKHTSFDFEWRLAGCTAKDMEYFEWHEKINAGQNNIVFLGTLKADSLKAELLNADLYVHPAYIDNSPNAVCEAMCLGLPIITTYVGGIPSLITNQHNGILIPANDPYTLSYQIMKMSANKEMCMALGTNARKIALERHNPKNILHTLLDVYLDIIQKHYGKTNINCSGDL